MCNETDNKTNIQKMILTAKAIEAINVGTIRPHLQIALKCDTEMTIRRYIRANKENGPLTTETALVEISKLTGLKRKEILEAAIMA